MSGFALTRQVLTLISAQKFLSDRTWSFSAEDDIGFSQVPTISGFWWWSGGESSATGSATVTAARRLSLGAARSFPFLSDNCQPEIFQVKEFPSLLLHQLQSPRAKFPQQIACLITECSMGFGFTSGTQAICVEILCLSTIPNMASQ